MNSRYNITKVDKGKEDLMKHIVAEIDYYLYEIPDKELEKLYKKIEYELRERDIYKGRFIVPESKL